MISIQILAEYKGFFLVIITSLCLIMPSLQFGIKSYWWAETGDGIHDLYDIMILRGEQECMRLCSS